MATIEIDENELTILRGNRRLLEELLGHKDTKGVTQKSIKKIHPDYNAPVDADEVLSQAKESAKQILEEDRKKAAAEKLEAEFNRDINSYRLSESNPNGYTDEGLDKIKNLMRERTIPDVHAAVALWEKLHPVKVEPPSGYVPTGWNFGAKGDDDKKLLFEDPDAWSDKEARKVWEEYRKAER